MALLFIWWSAGAVTEGLSFPLRGLSNSKAQVSCMVGATTSAVDSDAQGFIKPLPTFRETNQVT